MERKSNKSVAMISVWGFRLFVATAVALSIQGFESNRSDFLITESSIGQIELCEDFEKISLPFLGDTSSGCNGMYFNGKFYGNEDAEIMVEVPYPPSSERNHVSRIVTTSSAFTTVDKVRVGCTLNELIRIRPSLMLNFVDNEYSDIFLEERFSGTRIEFRLDSLSEEKLWQLPFGQYIMPFNEIRGIDEFLDSIGNTATIREIAIVLTSTCE